MGQGSADQQGMSNQGATARQITLADGRRLGYALYGAVGGKPLFFFHGWPGSRLRARVYAATAQRLGVQVIAVDRPGIGLSDAAPRRAILDWPADVAQLADTLDLDHFAVMGISGGGVYAAVCAHQLPQRITKAGIVVAPAPLDTPGILEGLLFVYRIGWQGYARYPLVAHLSSLFHSLSARHFPKILSSTYRSAADQLVYEKYGYDLLIAKRECFRQGFRHAATDVVIGTRAWGFDLSEIRAKIYLWYGGNDPAISVGMGQYLASEIGGSQLTVYPDEGHLLSITHAEEILGTLVT